MLFAYQQYPIADLNEWITNQTLRLNPEFQRREIWLESARSFLIDTLLRGLPIPPVYMRMQTNARTRTSYREVVDGQQRLRSIVRFLDGSLKLDSRAKEFEGITWDQLTVEQQEEFLSYQVPVIQLFDVDDSTVLDIFQRINAYGLPLNSQERRHGHFQDVQYRGYFGKP